jgi:two-component system, NtrC family, response regulator AtoC
MCDAAWDLVGSQGQSAASSGAAHGRSHQILAAGADPTILESVRTRLADRGHEIVLIAGAAECIRRFSAEGADLVILCLPLGSGSGADVVRSLREVDPRVTIVITGHDEQIPSAAEAFNLDAFEYIEDPTKEMSDLLAAVGGALGSRRGDAQLRYLKQRDASGSSWSTLVGNSTEMREVVDVLRRVAERTTRGSAPTILIRGETGTGKGLLAKCSHYNGVRRNHAFVEINCAAIPGTLLESELFGYERGAFTDARTSRAGLFETAHLGTLFLDEVGSMPVDLQAKLLTSIEEKKIRRLGGRQSVLVDVQIIAASHADLAEKVKNGSFRADLYHRLNVVSVTIPPLRKRGRDKLLLAETFIASMCREYGIPLRTLGDDAREHILEYNWPGNVRELRNQIERLLLLGNDEVIDRSHFERTSNLPPPPSDRPGFSLILPDDGIGLEEVERELIRRALDRFDGNVSRAARYLKVTRQTLIYRIKKHRLGEHGG